jgi:hypothetical protein
LTLKGSAARAVTLPGADEAYRANLRSSSATGAQRVRSRSHMEWTFIYLMVFLKLPIVALFWIVWWAVKADPDTDTDSSEGGGGSKRPREPFGPRPRTRGPHGDPRLPIAPRSRPVRAKARRVAGRPRPGSR